ncbi:uncharacterized protein [Aegilops tauschii subsp. strangulata]|uniref:uncharacterized protein n=1 Tax=Aegilops tauschii subsp. strangulata TaxID=200361 RepID=UPI001E1CA212|nr:uncharacterized protein LOC109763949 [Aegilops tauschii subsp. strangulata]
MADPATARSTRLHQRLPEEIVIWEILVRLPPKALLRCRAVCRAWRRATSVRSFLLAHHGRQPALPLISEHMNCGDRNYQNIITFDNRAPDAQVQHVAPVQLDDTIHLDASCDGLLLFTDDSVSQLKRKDTLYGACYSICNPATREHARLPMFSAFIPFGMYRHHPTGEYRILLTQENDDPAINAFYIFALGSIQPPRNIKGLHWRLEKHKSKSSHIIVFDTTAESLHEMRAPVVPDPSRANLFEMYDMLGMSIFNGEMKIIDIWMMQDYESEVWALKYRVELPVAYLNEQFGMIYENRKVAVYSCDGDVLVLVRFGEWLLHFDTDSRLVASFYHGGAISIIFI